MGLAENGADVVVADAKLDNLEEMTKKVRAMGRKWLSVAVDVTQEKSVADMVKSP